MSEVAVTNLTRSLTQGCDNPEVFGVRQMAKSIVTADPRPHYPSREE